MSYCKTIKNRFDPQVFDCGSGYGGVIWEGIYSLNGKRVSRTYVFPKPLPKKEVEMKFNWFLYWISQ